MKLLSLPGRVKLTTNARLAWLLAATTPQEQGLKSTLQVLLQRHSVVSWSSAQRGAGASGL